jgi:hypothetical protein
VSAADFDEMAGRLRARALSLMKQLDTSSSGYRAIIERELAARLEQHVPPAHACRCGRANDLDATFCKRCGTRLGPERGDGVEPADQPPPRLRRSTEASEEAEGQPPSESEQGWGPANTKAREH